MLLESRPDKVCMNGKTTGFLTFQLLSVKTIYRPDLTLINSNDFSYILSSNFMVGLYPAITICQGSSEIISLYRGIVISRLPI